MRYEKPYNQRSKVRASDEPNKKYILVYEGEETEAIYFNGIKEYKNQLKINPLIELISLEKTFTERGWSNPKKIVEKIERQLDENKNGRYSKLSIIEIVMDYLEEVGILNKDDNKNSKNIKKNIQQIVNDFKRKEFYKNELTDIVEVTIKNLSHSIEQIIDSDIIYNIITARNIVYSEGFDKICFIFDRDKESFLATEKNNQYEYVSKVCKDNNYGLYITNPCFEFWLLLHFNDVLCINIDDIKSNKKTKKKSFCEQELLKRHSSYSKSKYDFQFFINRIEVALKNEQHYCEDVLGLESKVGSNIGLLIKEIRK